MSLSVPADEHIVASFRWDAHGLILEVSPAFAALLRTLPDAWQPVTWDDLAARECRAANRRKLKQLAEAAHTRPWRTTFIDAAGRRVALLIQAARAESSDSYRGFAINAAEFEEAERNLQMLAGKLLKLYDDERRSIARELHDTTAQNLAALSMNLSMVAGTRDPARRREMMNECGSLTDECLKEIRSLAYMLHPPLLDELGLDSALRAFITLFERRYGIHVDLVVEPEIGRFATEVELGAFRIAQESLFNVQRHAQTGRAEVRLFWNHRRLEVVVRDWGRGITSRAARGDSLGVAGMRERVRLLGGRLEIRHANPGTQVRAVFQLDQSRDMPNPDSR